MATFSKVLLSGCTNGKHIKVTATATTGTTIHTAVSGTSNIDEIWLWANNTSSQEEVLTIEYGGTSSPDNLIVVSVKPYVGLVNIIPGLVLHNGLVISAFATTANVINISGYVNRITV